MPKKQLTQLKGKVFEHLLRVFLKRHGYDIVPLDIRKYYGISGKKNNIYLKGRGGKHQIDALGQFKFQIPFVYPIRLISEAKCWNDKIGLSIIRNFVGVLKDISENYFIEDYKDLEDKQRFRFTDCGVIFSTSQFTKPAQKYAHAQGIYLVPATGFLPVIDKYLLTDILTENVYFGLASSFYPIMIMSKEKIPLSKFLEKDEINVRIYYEYDQISKEVYGFRIEFKGWKGNFQLPKHIWDKYIKSPDFKKAMVNIKKRILNHIDIPLIFSNMRRIIRFKLDRSWIEAIENKL